MGCLPSTKTDPSTMCLKLVEDHSEYITSYEDSILSFSRHSLAVLEELTNSYVYEGFGTPHYYLGRDVYEIYSTWHQEVIPNILSSRSLRHPSSYQV
jgi:hypothetical protein